GLLVVVHDAAYRPAADEPRPLQLDELVPSQPARRGELLDGQVDARRACAERRLVVELVRRHRRLGPAGAGRGRGCRSAGRAPTGDDALSGRGSAALLRRLAGELLCRFAVAVARLFAGQSALDDLERQEVLTLLAQDPAEPLDIHLVELAVAGRRALGVEQALALEEPDLRDGDVGEL